MENKIKNIISESLTALKSLEEKTDDIQKIAEQVLSCLQEKGKLLICGNGGSAAQAQHMAAEIVGRFKKERRALPAIALSTDTSIITSLSNDYSFERVFERQVEALGKKGDLLIMLSTSGNSPNLLKASRAAKEIGIKTAGILGKDGGLLKKEADLSLVIDSQDTAKIQEAHLIIIHAVCELAEEGLSQV